MLSTLASILALGLLILLHELGHFGVARALGVPVPRFSIGFGRPIWRFVRGGTEWCIAWIPFGGYVRIAGLGPSDEDEPAASSDDGVAPAVAAEPADGFDRRPFWHKAAILVAGPGMNYLTALVMLSGVYMVGYPQGTDEARVGDIAPASAAAAAGLQAGDSIVSIDGKGVAEWSEMAAAITASEGREMKLSVVHGPRTGGLPPVEVRASARHDEASGRWMLGVTPYVETVRFGPGGAVVAAARQTVFICGSILGGLWRTLTGREKASFMGPVGIVDTARKSADSGLVNFVAFVTLINLAIFLFNMLPFPSLDGARILFAAAEAVARRPLNRRIEGLVHFVGLAVLMLMLVVVTIGDVLKLVK